MRSPLPLLGGSSPRLAADGLPHRQSRLLILGVETVLLMGVTGLNSFPLFALLLRIKAPGRLPGTFRLTAAPSPRDVLLMRLLQAAYGSTRARTSSTSRRRTFTSRCARALSVCLLRPSLTLSLFHRRRISPCRSATSSRRCASPTPCSSRPRGSSTDSKLVDPQLARRDASLACRRALSLLKALHRCVPRPFVNVVAA